jgi:hypothetical protein
LAKPVLAQAVAVEGRGIEVTHTGVPGCLQYGLRLRIADGLEDIAYLGASHAEAKRRAIAQAARALVDRQAVAHDAATRRHDGAAFGQGCGKLCSAGLGLGQAANGEGGCGAAAGDQEVSALHFLLLLVDLDE